MLMAMSRPDATVIGSGPNGLAAAITIAETGRKVVVYEAEPVAGGGVRSAELTLPGVVHDVCSAVHPMARVSPAFRAWPLGQYGLDWVEPPAMFAHPFDDRPAAVVYRSLARTADDLGTDGPAYRALIGAVVDVWPSIESAVLGPLRLPAHPLSLARFGMTALRPAASVCRSRFSTVEARALIAGAAAHGMLPLDRSPSAAVGIVLTAMAHVAGWVMPKGGAQRLTEALGAHLRALGGEIVTGVRVQSIDELPPARAILCDLSPKPLLRVAGNRFPGWYRRALEAYRYGMGVFKVDWALNGPIPWKDERCAQAGTVHLGGPLDEIARSERDAWSGRVAERPFTLVVQPTLFDPTRAPRDIHIAWTYCHVPHASNADMLEAITRQIERFAPGFRDRIIARAVMAPADLERHNANLVGGDIGAGAADLTQLFTRPTWRTYSTPLRGVYVCSAATPPGIGVHGMCGYWAAQRALREVLRD
jgi:phytoene dehydrogenase-like protein